MSRTQRDLLTSKVVEFIQSYTVPGLSVAIALHGRPIFQQAFGFADIEKKDPVTNASVFRIASCSKPITSTTIFSLVEQQKLKLEGKVFGGDGILGTSFGKPPYQPGVEQITVEQLLTHTCGGWSKGPDDPMFRQPELDHKGLISSVIKQRPLDFQPGTHYAYSNFGFSILGRVVEKLTGSRYADYVSEQVLKRCGVDGMRIAGNGPAKRGSEEVHYYDQEGGDPYGMNVARLDSAGGWLATPSDLVRFATHVDGFAADENILKPDSIAAMTTGSSVNPRYAKGWEVNERGNWWHIGDLPGTSAVLLRTASGYCAAAFMNTRRMKPDIRLLLERLTREMVQAVS